MSSAPVSISPSARIYPGVIFGKSVVVEDFCIIGCPPSGVAEGALETMIGDGAIIRSFSVIYAGNRIGKNFQTGNKANIRENNVIGDDVSVGTLSVVEHHVKIADSVRIHSQAFIPEYSELRRGAWVGPNVVFTNAAYPLAPGAKRNLRGPVLEENCKIGANSTLLPGVRIGRGSLVGAGSVVTKDVAEGVVVAGNPAKFLKRIESLPYGKVST